MKHERSGIPRVNALNVEDISKKILLNLSLEDKLRGSSFEEGVSLEKLREETLANKKEDLSSILMFCDSINYLIDEEYISYTLNDEPSITIYPSGREKVISEIKNKKEKIY